MLNNKNIFNKICNLTRLPWFSEGVKIFDVVLRNFILKLELIALFTHGLRETAVILLYSWSKAYALDNICNEQNILRS